MDLIKWLVQDATTRAQDLSLLMRPKWLSETTRSAADAAGLVALADLETTALRTALTGTSSLFDAFILCPGLHRQQDAPDLSKGEYPACAAMTTGYVFRVENEATVLQLQRQAKTGHLTTLSVSSTSQDSVDLRRSYKLLLDYSLRADSICYSCAVALSITIFAVLLMLKDWWAVTSMTLLICVRFINVVVLQRRAALGWKGKREPGVQGDLLVLLSQDRWVRMRGAVDDLKAVTSGQWLRKPSSIESSLVSLATLLAYINAGLASNARSQGKSLLVMLLLSSAALLGLANQKTEKFHMYGRIIRMEKAPVKYARRLHLASELIKEAGRNDWAIRLGMVQPESTDGRMEQDMGPKMM
ncbi:hypothetical protein LTR37_018101 [Vermiconidia calcicola]|uniref:Uncharacterized protein n=1 Tax=Vermiconidia calcicola TaxID=1690605 RepID=A0ACC3MJK6_9PEZI|nr:hypothetical protein LTR37_018101 [Vermiconidia calcicola]